MDSGLDQTIVLFCPRLSPMFLNPASFLSWKLSGLMTLTAGKLSRQGGMKVLEGVSYTNGLLLWASCCRRRLIAWSKEKFSKDHELAGQLLGELEQIQSSFILNNARELEISAQLSSIWAREEKFWQQRSRISWLPNTRFVHLTTMQRRCKNKITRVANEDGVWAEENGDIRDTFETFFMDLYKSDGKRLGESFNWVASVHYPGDECFVMLSFYQ
ncbi:hypothetical protein ACFX15_008336 [Malus domestica]